MSAAQIAQRIIHESKCEDINQKHDPSFVKTLLINECENIISSAGKNIKSSEITTYKKSLNIASKWIKNYTEFNFRSLGSYSISELDEIGSSEQSIN